MSMGALSVPALGRMMPARQRSIGGVLSDEMWQPRPLDAPPSIGLQRQGPCACGGQCGGANAGCGCGGAEPGPDCGSGATPAGVLPVPPPDKNAAESNDGIVSFSAGCPDGEAGCTWYYPLSKMASDWYEDGGFARAVVMALHAKIGADWCASERCTQVKFGGYDYDALIDCYLQSNFFTRHEDGIWVAYHRCCCKADSAGDPIPFPPLGPGDVVPLGNGSGDA